MVALDALQGWSLFKRAASMLSSRGRRNCMAGTRATGVLGLLVASVSLLVFAGAALAHVPVQRDDERPAHYASQSLSEPVEAIAPQECISTATVVVSVVIQAADARFPLSEPDGVESDCDCCGVACHAALGDVGRPSAARRLPASVAALTGSPFLHGRSQGPPERPPRLT
jgi:hypothetical protein